LSSYVVISPTAGLSLIESSCSIHSHGAVASEILQYLLFEPVTASTVHFGQVKEQEKP
jgi:hypothetical protein